MLANTATSQPGGPTQDGRADTADARAATTVLAAPTAAFPHNENTSHSGKKLTIHCIACIIKNP